MQSRSVLSGSRRSIGRGLLLPLGLLLISCGGASDVDADSGHDGGVADVVSGDTGAEDGGPADTGPTDLGRNDLGRDAETKDADSGAADLGADAGGPDAGLEDSGPPDVGPADTGATDAEPGDVGPTDTGATDAEPKDAGPADTGAADAEPADVGPADAGALDAGPPDAGFYRITAVGEWDWLEANDYSTGRTLGYTTCPPGGCCHVDVPVGWGFYGSTASNSLCINYMVRVTSSAGGAGLFVTGPDPFSPNDPTTCTGSPTADAVVVSSRVELTSPSTCNPSFTPTSCSPNMCGFVSATFLSCPSCPTGQHCASNFCVTCPP